MLPLDMSKHVSEAEPLSHWLKQALATSGISQAALAEEMNRLITKKLDRSSVNKMVLGKRAISAEELLAIAEITGHPLPREGQPRRTVTIAGKVGAGARVPVFDAYEKGDGPQVEAPPQISASGVVAVEVQGDSMEPVYSDGDLLFYTRVAPDAVPIEAINHRCVCEDESGMGWVKQVKRGTEPGLFHLISLNPGATTMWDIRLKWAAPVKFYLPAEYAIKHEAR